MSKCRILLSLFAFLLLVQVLVAVPYTEQEENVDDYNDNLDRLLQNAQNGKADSLMVKRREDYPIKLLRRSCIKRGASCDHRPNDCCYSSSCRCNFWGTNCRCERMGLFQQWGK